VTWFEVECEADESIHPHNAFAYQQEPAPAAINVFPRDLGPAAQTRVPAPPPVRGAGPDYAADGRAAAVGSQEQAQAGAANARRE
jgi:hypothetical protein